MLYDFSKEINRYNTASIKWDAVEKLFGEPELLPMWVADMDFRVPRPVLEAIKQRTEHGIFGYTSRPVSYYEAVINWFERRHHWQIEQDWICHSPGVVPALSYIVQSFTEPGDKVIIQPPVYHPFTSVVENNGRQILHNPLKFENDRYTMDFDDLRSKLDPSVKLLILCSPHNPVSRVWSKEELTELGNICLAHHVLIVSDEIHCDLLFKDQQHTPFASLSAEFAQNTIICTAPSKTFNLAGLQTSNIIIPNENLRQKFNQTMSKLCLTLTNTFGVVATEAAYRYGDEWLDQLLGYMQQNLDFMTEFLEKNVHGIKVIKPEGTYLVWLDCRELGFDEKGLEQFMRKNAKIALDDGYIFGPGGEGFTRINIACPRSILQEGLKRIEKALEATKV